MSIDNPMINTPEDFKNMKKFIETTVISKLSRSFKEALLFVNYNIIYESHRLKFKTLYNELLLLKAAYNELFKSEMAIKVFNADYNRIMQFAMQRGEQEGLNLIQSILEKIVKAKENEANIPSEQVHDQPRVEDDNIYFAGDTSGNEPSVEVHQKG